MSKVLLNYTNISRLYIENQLAVCIIYGDNCDLDTNIAAIDQDGHAVTITRPYGRDFDVYNLDHTRILAHHSACELMNWDSMIGCYTEIVPTNDDLKLKYAGDRPSSIIGIEYLSEYKLLSLDEYITTLKLDDSTITDRIHKLGPIFTRYYCHNHKLHYDDSVDHYIQPYEREKYWNIQLNSCA